MELTMERRGGEVQDGWLKARAKDSIQEQSGGGSTGVEGVGAPQKFQGGAMPLHVFGWIFVVSMLAQQLTSSAQLWLVGRLPPKKKKKLKCAAAASAKTSES